MGLLENLKEAYSNIIARRNDEAVSKMIEKYSNTGVVAKKSAFGRIEFYIPSKLTGKELQLIKQVNEIRLKEFASSNLNLLRL